MLRILWFILLCSCQPPEQASKSGKRWGKKKKEVQAPLLVDVSSVSIGSVSNYHEFTGTLESKSEATIIPDVSGLVKTVHVREGDAVKVGDPLADLVNPTVDAALQRATIELKRAKREFDKTKQLQRQGAVSKRDYQEANSAFETAQASFIEAEKSKKRLMVASPLDGVVSTVSVRAGEQAGATEAFTVVDPRQLRLVASIPESNMGNLKAGFQVVISAAYDGKRRANGSIERLAPVVDARTGSIKVFIDLETGQDQLLPGQFVRAKVKTDVHENVLVIPKSALVYQDGQPSVFVLGPPPKIDSDKEDESSEKSDKDSAESEKGEPPPKATHSAISTDLKIGYSDEHLVEIVDGLKEGDRVITLGNTALRSGSPVRIEESVKNKEGEETP